MSAWRERCDAAGNPPSAVPGYGLFRKRCQPFLDDLVVGTAGAEAIEIRRNASFQLGSGPVNSDSSTSLSRRSTKLVHISSVIAARRDSMRRSSDVIDRVNGRDSNAKVR